MKNYQAGALIKTLDELKRERIVFVPRWNRTCPVAFLRGWMWRTVDAWVIDGCFRKAIKKAEPK